MVAVKNDLVPEAIYRTIIDLIEIGNCHWKICGNHLLPVHPII
jgi:hypothetical protein